MTHYLIIVDCPDDPWDIRHDEDCPTFETYDGMAFDYACDVGREVSNVGLDPRLASLPPGEYEIEYWERRVPAWCGGPDEVTHAGIRTVDEVSSVLDDLDPEWWKEIIRQGRKTDLPWRSFEVTEVQDEIVFKIRDEDS